MATEAQATTLAEAERAYFAAADAADAAFNEWRLKDDAASAAWLAVKAAWIEQDRAYRALQHARKEDP